MPKMKLPAHLQALKANLDKEGNLIDYFLLIDINQSMCLDNSLYENLDQNEIKEKQLIPEIFSKCPPFDKSSIAIDEGVINYCLTKGFKLKFSKQSIKPKYFSFILDNNFYSYDYPQKYITFCAIYESLFKYKQLQNKSESLQSIYEYDMITNNDKLYNDNNEINKLNMTSMGSINTCASSNFTSINNNSDLLNDTNDSNDNDNNDNSLFKTSIFSMMNSSMRKPKTSSNLSLDNINKKQKFNYLKNYYVPKCLCLISIYPYLYQHKTILEKLFTYTLINQPIPIEKIIPNLIIELSLSPRALYKIDYQLIKEKLNLEQTQMNQLSIINFNMHKIFKCFKNFDTIMKIIKHVLFETKIIFFSECYWKICKIILSFLILIYPFKFPFQVTSYVPKANYNLIGSISPFIFGINEKFSKDFFLIMN